MRNIYNTLVLLGIVLLASCTKESPIAANRPLPPAGMAEVTLGGIRLSDQATVSPAQISAAARATTSNLTEGATLRLYAFKKGTTNFYDKLATRTYTINAAGTPVSDAGQDPLYLPLGDVDIYLAGPIQHNVGTTDSPVWQDVAGEYDVMPRQGIDLITAYTSATIVAGAVNPLPDMTLTHKMAKVQVVVARHESAAYENLVVKQIKLYNQPQSGTFTFDATGGVITPAAETLDFSFATISEETLHEKYSGTALLIPQPSKELKIETTFECNQINEESSDNHPTVRYRQSGLITTALDAGSATRFTAKPLTPVEIKWRATVLPWDTVDQGTIVVPPDFKSLPPVSDALAICLDGYNAPKTIDGKTVWEDLGTTKNHAQLMNDKVTWADDGYVFTDGGYMQLIKTLTETGVTANSFSFTTIEIVFVPDNGPTSPNEGLLRIYNNETAYPGSQIWKGNFYGDDYQGQSEYGGNSRWRVMSSGAGTAAGVTHSVVWRDGHGGGANLLFVDGVKYTNSGGSAAGYTYCVIGYALTPNASNKINRDYFSGKIKAVRIHSRALTEEEILKNYQFDKGYYGI